MHTKFMGWGFGSIPFVQTEGTELIQQEALDALQGVCFNLDDVKFYKPKGEGVAVRAVVPGCPFAICAHADGQMHEVEAATVLAVGGKEVDAKRARKIAPQLFEFLQKVS